MPIRVTIVTPNQLLGDSLSRALASVDDIEIAKIRNDLSEATVAAAKHLGHHLA